MVRSIEVPKSQAEAEGSKEGCYLPSREHDGSIPQEKGVKSGRWNSPSSWLPG